MGCKTVFEDRSRWLMPTLALVLALAIGGVMAAKPVWRRVRLYRAHRILDQAEPLAKAGQWQALAPLLRTAIGFAPRELRTLRLVAQYDTAIRSPQAIQDWQALVATGQATYEERRTLASLAVVASRPDIAGPLLDKLIKENPQDSTLYIASLTLARRLRQPALQLDIAERWLKQSPDEIQPQFEVGALQISGTNLAARDSGKRLLWGVAFSSNQFTLPALSVLAGSLSSNPVEAQLLWRRLETLAPTNVLADAEIRLRLRPGERTNILQAVVDSVRPDSPAPAVRATVQWLADHQGVDRLLPLLTPDRLKSDPALGAARIQALIELGRLDEIRLTLDAPPTNLPPHLLQCLLASAANAEGRKDDVVAHLERGAQVAGNVPSAHYGLARFAEHLGQPKLALARWQHIALNFGGGVESGMQVLRLARLTDDLPTAQTVLKSLRNQMPTDLSVVLAAGYLDGLIGKLPPEHLPQLRDIARTNQANPQAQAVVALAEWRNGDAAGALQRMTASNRDWTKEDARTQAVYAAILGAAGQREMARVAARRVSASGLAREERALLQPWL